MAPSNGLRLTVTLLSLGFFPGISLADGLHAALVDTNGKPVVGAKVTSSFYDPTIADEKKRFQNFKATSAADGSITFGNWDAKYKDHLPLALGITMPNGDVCTASLLEDGAKIFVNDRQSSVLFKVVDSKGKGLAGVSVSAGFIMVETKSGAFSLTLGKKPGTTGSDGTIVFDKIPVGESLSYTVGGDGFPETHGKVVPTSTSQVTQTITLNPGVILRGTVTKDGMPVPGIYVDATTYVLKGEGWMGEGQSGKTDANGQYKIVTSPGSIEVTIRPRGDSSQLYTLPIRGVRASAGQELDGLDLALVPPVVIRGKVLVQGTNQPVPNALIVGSDPGDSHILTGADGTFKVEVPPGDIQLRVDKVGDQSLDYDEASLNGSVDADHNPPLVFYVPQSVLLPAITNLKGTVRDAQGKPVPGATVGLVGDGELYKTDAQGNYQFDRVLKPGDKVYAVTPTAAVGTATTLLKDSTVDFVLDSSPGAFAGRVVDDQGLPVPGVKIVVFGEKNNLIFPVQNLATDGQGAFKISGLFPKMDYVVEFEKDGYSKGGVHDQAVVAGKELKLADVCISRADTTVTGTVLTPEGKPASGISVVCLEAQSSTATTDATGKFVLTHAPRGDIDLMIQTLDGSSGSAKAKGGQTGVAIKMDPRDTQVSAYYQNMAGQKAGQMHLGDWLSDAKFDLADLKGKIVVIDLWAVWCSPCVKALPDVQSLADRYKDKGVAVIGIHTAGTPLDKAKAFVKQKGLTYPTFMDVKVGQFNSEIFPAKGIPQLYVISPDGLIVCDTHDVSEAEDAVKALLAKKTQ